MRRDRPVLLPRAAPAVNAAQPAWTASRTTRRAASFSWCASGLAGGPEDTAAERPCLPAVEAAKCAAERRVVRHPRLLHRFNGPLWAEGLPRHTFGSLLASCSVVCRSSPVCVGRAEGPPCQRSVASQRPFRCLQPGSTPCSVGYLLRQAGGNCGRPPPSFTHSYRFSASTTISYNKNQRPSSRTSPHPAYPGLISFRESSTQGGEKKLSAQAP